jgi:hypothetical protein
MKRFIIAPLVVLMLLATSALADDPKPVDKPATTPAVTAGDVKVDPVKSDDPVADAEKVIDDGIKKIDEDPGEAISTLTQLAKEGRWGPFVGLLLMFLIWVLRKFIWKLIPKNALPWVTLGVGIIATGAIELGLGVTWWKVLIDSLGTSGIAMALWSMIFKHIMKPKEENA